jgi:hypothetical protein
MSVHRFGLEVADPGQNDANESDFARDRDAASVEPVGTMTHPSLSKRIAITLPPISWRLI